ncbi:MAG: response regulator [Victivallales bacterium]|nr:response regulator [Victivallales bacterium]
MAKRVLVIDDQPFMIKLIEYNLKKEGYETVTETDGLRALDRIEDIAPDLVFLDIRMPSITGTELCSMLRQKDIMRDVPIIILTGQFQKNIEEDVRAAGANAFMTKPFSPFALRAEVRMMLGDKEEGGNGRITGDHGCRA